MLSCARKDYARGAVDQLHFARGHDEVHRGLFGAAAARSGQRGVNGGQCYDFASPPAAQVPTEAEAEQFIAKSNGGTRCPEAWREIERWWDV
jgi:hypothetical protein